MGRPRLRGAVRCSNDIGSHWWFAQAATGRSMPDGPSAGHGNETPESRMTGNRHVRFGGRAPQKYRPGNRRQLGGGPPNYRKPMIGAPSEFCTQVLDVQSHELAGAEATQKLPFETCSPAAAPGRLTGKCPACPQPEQ